MTFVAATGNPNKVREMARILAPLGFSVISQKEAGVCVSPEETGKTFEENARIKAEAVCRAAKRPTVADDSGLCAAALGGAPGIRSARWAGEKATDDDRIDKLLGLLAAVPEEKRAATFVCAVCCVFPDGRSLAVRGECAGHIAFARRGADGFGYDPVFIEDTTGRTFAELSGEEKDALGHRGRALRAFAAALEQMKKEKKKEEPGC